MTCEEITTGIMKLQKLYSKFCHTFSYVKVGDGSIQKAFEIKSQIEDKVRETSLFSYGAIVGKKFNDEKSLNLFLTQFIEITPAQVKLNDHYMDELADILFKDIDTAKIRKVDYQKFIDILSSPKIQKTILSRIKSTPGTGFHYEKIFGLINSAFARRVAKITGSANMPPLPDNLRKVVGLEWHEGTLVAEDVGDGALNSMTGGVAKVKKAGHAFCFNKIGGAVVAEQSEDSPGVEMTGGTLFVRNLEGRFGDVRSGTILVENILRSDAMALISDEARPYTFLYNNTDGKYKNLQGQTAVEIDDVMKLHNYTSIHHGGVIVITTEVNHSVFFNYSNFIMVIKKLKSLLDIDMSLYKGMVILEDPKYNPEEVRSFLMRKHPNRVILMRVPDPENPEKTTLVDVGAPVIDLPRRGSSRNRRYKK